MLVAPFREITKYNNSKGIALVYASNSSSEQNKLNISESSIYSNSGEGIYIYHYQTHNTTAYSITDTDIFNFALFN